MFLYKCHTGGYFLKENKLDISQLHCNKCIKSDEFIGEVNNKKDLRILLAGVINFDNPDDWQLEEIYKSLRD